MRMVVVMMRVVRVVRVVVMVTVTIRLAQPLMVTRVVVPPPFGLLLVLLV